MSKTQDLRDGSAFDRLMRKLVKVPKTDVEATERKRVRHKKRKKKA